MNAAAMVANLIVIAGVETTNTLTGGSGNNTFELTNAHFTSSDTITGGAGADTIQLTDTAAFTLIDTAFTHVTSVETLKIGGTGTDTLTVGAFASADSAPAAR